MQLTRKFVLGAAALAAVSASTVEAQQVRFAGNTLGCFYTGAIAAPGALPCALGAFSSVPGGLSFTAGSFDFFTDPAGMSGVSYGGIGSAPGVMDNLGTVASAGGAFTAPADLYLRLRIFFTTPNHTADVNGNGNPSLNVFDIDYRVSGSSSAPNVGGISFTPTGPGLYTPGAFGQPGFVIDPVNGQLRTGNIYTGPFTSGQVNGGGTANGMINYHTLDSRSITSGQSASLTSFLQIESTVTSVPEPATVALMATGLLGIVGAGVVRRRSAV